MKTQEALSDGVTAPEGFLAAGIAAGIKKDRRPDLALLFSRHPCAAAGVFTRNRFRAAPVELSARHLARGTARAVLINSGNANACTGPQGARDALRMATLAARGLGIPLKSVCVASTGVIGEPLPMDRIGQAIPLLIPKLSRTGGSEAAEAILTTDSRRKEVTLRARIAGESVTLGGMAKGAGMIHPRMATLLGFLTTDARISPVTLRRALREAVDESFNRISVDGDTSTNDMVLALASGQGHAAVPSRGEDYRSFAALLTRACQELAQKVAWDGEGATKRVTLRIEGARNRREAIRVAEAVVRSPLVKTALFGEDANWGRILAAAGASGASLSLSRISLFIGGAPLVIKGIGQGKDAEASAARHLKADGVDILLRLGLGSAAVTYWTCDFSLDYVRINAAYRS